MKVGFCVGELMDVALYLQSESKEAGYEVEIWREDSGDLSSIQGLFCLSERRENRAERLKQLANQAMEKGIPVIWAVDGEELPGAFQEFTDFVLLENVIPLLQALLSLPKTEDVSKEAGRRKWTIPTLTKKKTEVAVEQEEMQPMQVEQKPPALSNVIAVGGPSGCGSSFISWNIATLLQAVLVEGRKTATLAKWLEVEEENTRTLFLEGKLHTTAAVTAQSAITTRELQFLSQVGETVVIDVGNDLSNEIWKLAETKLFVLSPDPQFRDIEIPYTAKRILNRYPDLFPAKPENVFQVKMDLVVPDLGREAFLSLWSKNPWILKQSEEVKQAWRQIVGKSKKEEVASNWNVSM